MQPDRQMDALINEWRTAEHQPFSGWDFSFLRDSLLDEKPPWSYENLARNLMRGATAVLDLGTGGGEKLLSLKDAWPPRVVAIEGYPPNVALATQRLAPLGVQVVACDTDLKTVLPFPQADFDLVINRHSGFSVAQVDRVLKPDGVFLTQQVDGTSLQDLMAAFASKPEWPWSTLDFYCKQMKSTSLVPDLTQDWTGRMIFKTVAALVYYLKAIPWLVDGFSVTSHLPYLQKQQARLEREGRLEFEQKLFLLRSRKSSLREDA